jgi:hypothetical protein
MKSKFWIYAFIFTPGLIFLGPACSKQNESAPAIAMGKSYGGGKIFYVDGTGQHGFVASGTFDVAVTAPWSNGSLAVTNAVSETDGLDNTNK